jgi:hypothetical protein
MEKRDKKMVFSCALVGMTKKYMKYQLPEEVRDFENGVVLFSGKSIYVGKGESVEEIELVLGRNGD